MTPAPRAAAPPHDHDAIRRDARVQFDRWARSYDRSRLNEFVFFPTIRLCLEEIARWQQANGAAPLRMLDVGCGTGRLIALVAQRPDVKIAVGADYSPVMVQRCSERLSALGVPRASVVVADAERLPFATGSFDVLTCCNSFHHYPHQRQAVAEFYRVLRPGGRLIVVDGFRDNVIGWMIFDVVVTSIEKTVYHAPWSVMREMAATTGFHDIHQRKMNVLAPLLVTTAAR